MSERTRWRQFARSEEIVKKSGIAPFSVIIIIIIIIVVVVVIIIMNISICIHLVLFCSWLCQCSLCFGRAHDPSVLSFLSCLCIILLTSVSQSIGMFSLRLLVGGLTYQLHASVSKGGSAQTVVRAAVLRQVADPTSHFTPGQPFPAITLERQAPGRVAHWSTNFQITAVTRPRKIPTGKGRMEPRSFAVEVDALPLGPLGAFSLRRPPRWLGDYCAHFESGRPRFDSHFSKSHTSDLEN